MLHQKIPTSLTQAKHYAIVYITQLIGNNATSKGIDEESFTALTK